MTTLHDRHTLAGRESFARLALSPFATETALAHTTAHHVTPDPGKGIFRYRVGNDDAAAGQGS